MLEQPLKEYVFVFTGEMQMPREEARERVVLLGAKVTTAISGKTTHLITGTEPGENKIAKAQKHGTKIMDEEEFNILLEGLSPKDLINTKITSASEENIPRKVEKSVAGDRVAWAEKYRPKRRDDLIGNPSIISQLEDFLKGKSTFKAALLSGPPGVGKTTAAHLLSGLNGYEPIEFNASSLRNKSNLQESVGHIANSGTFNGTKRILIMDEVDGMSSDKGGILELVNIIKASKALIMCICNDKNHPKMRTLAGHCLDLHFRKLDVRAVLHRMESILKKEGRQISTPVLSEIIHKCSCDMRYVLNTIQHLQNARISDVMEKNLTKGIFEVAVELFQKRSVGEKTDLYFENYGILPLFVQENYIKSRFTMLRDFWKSADSISLGDLVDSRIHGSAQEWSLMPYHAFFSTIYPTHGLSLRMRVEFPQYLGQASKAGKNGRMLFAIGLNLKHRTDRMSLALYAGQLLDRIFMAHVGAEDIDRCIAFLEETQLTKDDMVALNSVLRDDFKKVPARVKSALTRGMKKLKQTPHFRVAVDGPEGMDGVDE